MIYLKMLLSRKKQPVTLKKETGRHSLELKMVLSVKKQHVALVKATSHYSLAMMKSLYVKKPPVALEKVTDRHNLKSVVVALVICVQLSSMQDPPLPCHSFNQVVIVR
ncbi:hypothetical protein L3X38_027240 [Prunus dulcis]|uniref:Uncharacterized protein n=1 Tax=Prunus dulcis TaxID=3755 RepID=A0AAD4VP29_PRUDU|nr:hypothetical protein L3X38_027240 [Prunus dulcis]